MKYDPDKKFTEEEKLLLLKNKKIRPDRIEKTIYTFEELMNNVKLRRKEILRRIWLKKYKGETPKSVRENRNEYFRNYQRAKRGILPDKYHKNKMEFTDD